MDGSQFVDRKKEKRAKWSKSVPKSITHLQANHSLHIANIKSLNLGHVHVYNPVSGGAPTLFPQYCWCDEIRFLKYRVASALRHVS